MIINLDPQHPTDFHGWWTVLFTVLQLAILPFVVASVVPSYKRYRAGVTRAKGKWNPLRIVAGRIAARKHRRLWIAAEVIAALLVLSSFGSTFDALELLLAQPLGALPALAAIALGVSLGQVVARRGRHRRVNIGAVVVVAATVYVTLLFSAQFANPAAGTGVASTQATDPAGPQATDPAAPQATQPGAQTTAPTSPTALEPSRGPVETATVKLGSGRYTLPVSELVGTADAICAQGYGATPVGVDAGNPSAPVIATAGGEVLKGVGVYDLLPCSHAGGEAPVYRAPGSVMRELGGKAYPMSETTPVRLVAFVEAPDGQVFGWVFRTDPENGVYVLHTGLVPQAELVPAS